jgi:hypothetical protein
METIKRNGIVKRATQFERRALAPATLVDVAA